MEKSIFRGLSEKEIKTFKNSDIFTFYTEHSDELFLGVRNGYVNIYYKGASICRVENLANGKIKHCISKKYSRTIEEKYKNNIDKNGYINLDNGEDIKDNFKEIKAKIDKDYSSDGKKEGSKAEKTAQQKLIMQNNKNADSKWFCLDMEYIRQRNDSTETNSGRFDIIAISKEKPCALALVELKFGSGAIGGNSGISKHLNDFDEYIKADLLKKHLIPEMIAMIETYNALGITTPFENIKKSDFEKKPKIYIITLGSKKTTRQTMRNYIFTGEENNGKASSSVYNFETKYNKTFSDLRYKPIFYFSEGNGDDIDDILDESKYHVEIF